MHVAWDGGGAHFVCVDETTDVFGISHAMINDPGDGDVHLTFIPVGATVRFKTGKMSGWIVRRK